MAVSRSLRYQVLRRDGYRCQYCGATAKDAKLTVDHVTAVALGGTDTADNLVTACEPCNGGKSATPADAALVAQVQERDAQFRAAVADVGEDDRERRWFAEAFLEAWDLGELPAGWRKTIDAYRQQGLAPHMWDEIISIARDKTNLDDPFRYCCGIARNQIKKIQEQAAELAALSGIDDDSDGTDELDIEAAVAFSRAWSPGISGFRELNLAVSAALWEQYDHEVIVRAAEWSGEIHEPDITLFLSLEGEVPMPDQDFHNACFDAWHDNWTLRNEVAAWELEELLGRRLCLSVVAAFRRGYDPELIQAAAALAGRCNDTNVTHFLPRWSPRLKRMEEAAARQALEPAPEFT